jgi:hypothetical protein
MHEALIQMLDKRIADMQTELEAAKRLRKLLPTLDTSKPAAQRTPAKAKKDARSIAQRKRWAEEKRRQREAAKAAKDKAAKK